MIVELSPRRVLAAAAAVFAITVALAPPSGAQEQVRRNTAIDEFLARDAQTQAAKQAAKERMRGGASGLGMRAKTKEPVASEPAAAQAGTMQRFRGSVWVEGPGFDVSYGLTYERCAEKCLANDKCVMIEFYRPEKKCNLYSSKRPTKKGGSSDVAVRG